MWYRIYHPTHGRLNSMCRFDCEFEYEFVTLINADCIEQAFVRAQNDLNDEYAACGYRSTSVGDIIHCDEEDKDYMVDNVGFKEIDPDIKNYIDFSDPVHAQYLAQDILDNPENYELI